MWIYDQYQKLACAANLFTVPPMPSHGLLPCEVAKKFHSALTLKSASWKHKISQVFKWLPKNAEGLLSHISHRISQQNGTFRGDSPPPAHIHQSYYRKNCLLWRKSPSIYPIDSPIITLPALISFPWSTMDAKPPQHTKGSVCPTSFFYFTTNDVWHRSTITSGSMF